MRLPIVSLLLALLAWQSPAFAAPPCTIDGARLVAAREKLATLRVPEIETDLPAGADRLVERLKDEIRGFVKAQMRCAPAEPDPNRLEQDLFSRGGGLASRPDRVGYGSALSYSVRRISGHPTLIGIVATIGIPCGSDSFLMLHERRAGGWSEVMVRRSAPYRSIKGGWEGLAYEVSRPDKSGDWYVATAAITPWCSSAWMGLGYSLARPGPDPALPRIILGRSTSTHIGTDQAVRMTASPNLFEIRYAGHSLDPEVLIRNHVEAYALDGASVHRVQPAATNVRDFVDEWLTSPLDVAAQWAAPGIASAALRRRFGESAEFLSVRRCSDGKHQVELAGAPGRPRFMIVGGSNPYRVEGVAMAGSPRCAGPDLKASL